MSTMRSSSSSCDYERRRQTDTVERHSRVEAVIQERVGQSLRHLRLWRMQAFGGLVGHDFDGADESLRPDIANARDLPESLQCPAEAGAKRRGPLDEPFVFEDLNITKRNGTAGRVARVGVRVHPTLCRGTPLMASRILSETPIPPSGTYPLVMPFANCMMSGSTP